ncbi:MAG TPA: FkbM family methyltransferase [Verrucomicrobiales bacterium]|nr:FkbM family methyltransferase [Verrucomicrobiales bacterium]
MDWDWKRWIERAAWSLSRDSPFLRTVLRPVGLRTNLRRRQPARGSVFLPCGTQVQLYEPGRNYLSFELHWKGWEYYEPASALLFAELAKQANCVLDVGANIGYFTFLACAAPGPRKVWSFEPNPRLAAILRHNLEDNRLNAEAVEAAISNVEGTADLALSWSDMSASLDGSFKGAPVTRSVEVRTVTLDGFAAAKALPSSGILIKIDVEGHEPQVLAGASALIERARPDIVLEVSDDYDPAILEQLADLGYRAWEIRQEGLRETDRLTLIRQGGLTVLNRLLTARPAEAVADLSARIVPRLRKIDPRRTSQFRGKGPGDHQPPAISKA